MPLETIAQSIRDAVAPVFLLTGIAGMLNVMTARLGRIIDRYRKLEDNTAGPPPEAALAELAILYRRAEITHWAIGTCTFSALLICLVIGLIFVGTELYFSPARAISLLFIASMVALIAGLVLFLAEVRLATGMLVPIKRVSEPETSPTRRN